MAFAEYNISSIAQIPALVQLFATNNGWDVSAGADGPVLRHPNYEGLGPGGMEFALSAEINGNEHDVIWSGIAGRAFARSPILTTQTTPTIVVTTSLPTKLFLISMLEPEPYLAMVIEYGYNWYRHLYLGFMEKIGNYTGGEVISGTSLLGLNNGSNRTWNLVTAGSLLFSANQSVNAASDNGGVHIEHADNPQSWRTFSRLRNIPSSNGNLDNAIFNGSEVIGGCGDCINDGFVARGQNTYAGTSVLTPVDLYATQIVTGDLVRFRPIGRPAGVRMINIEDLEAQDEVLIGDETWHTFAARKKDANPLVMSTAGNNRYPTSDSTYYLGYAYRSA